MSLQVCECLLVNCFVRGYHEFTDVWQTEINEEYFWKLESVNKILKKCGFLLSKQMTALHEQYYYGLAFIPTKVRINMKVGGQFSRLIVVWVTKFLKRAANIGKVIIKGKTMNRGSRYDLVCMKFEETVFPATG